MPDASIALVDTIIKELQGQCVSYAILHQLGRKLFPSQHMQDKDKLLSIFRKHWERVGTRKHLAAFYHLLDNDLALSQDGCEIIIKEILTPKDSVPLFTTHFQKPHRDSRYHPCAHDNLTHAEEPQPPTAQASRVPWGQPKDDRCLYEMMPCMYLDVLYRPEELGYVLSNSIYHGHGWRYCLPTSSQLNDLVGPEHIKAMDRYCRQAEQTAWRWHPTQTHDQQQHIQRRLRQFQQLKQPIDADSLKQHRITALHPYMLHPFPVVLEMEAEDGSMCPIGSGSEYRPSQGWECTLGGSIKKIHTDSKEHQLILQKWFDQQPFTIDVHVNDTISSCTKEPCRIRNQHPCMNDLIDHVYAPIHQCLHRVCLWSATQSAHRPSPSK